ncbi:helix-turn-helix domain-containing protein [Streptomyces sp. LE64]|uniref:helix-turn-helix domain-containing protein n=1 Tax=Streptomyces sp. LE64 TaxID=3448653 RepID=UPI004041E664
MVNIKDLNPDESPQAALGARLRQKRLDLGLKQKELARKLGYSPTQLSHTETGRKMATLRFVQKVDSHFGLTDTSESFERQWREIKFGALLEGFPEYLGLEERASEIRLFEVGVIPGQLQTRGYAQALADAAVERGEITPEKAAERIEHLIRRQNALNRTTPPLICAVLDESCIRRPVGDDPKIMQDQLAHLIRFARLPHTSFQIAPYSMGARRPFDRLVSLLTLPDRSVVSYVESQAQGQLDRELSSVLPRVRNYHLLQTESASQAESVAMIEQLRKGTL